MQEDNNKDIKLTKEESDFLKLCSKVGFNPNQNFYGVKLLAIEKKKINNKNILNFKFNAISTIPMDDFKKFKMHLKETFSEKTQSKIVITFTFDTPITDIDLLCKYLKKYINYNQIKLNARQIGFLDPDNLKIENNIAIITIHSKKDEEYLNSKKDLLKDLFQKVGHNDIEFKFVLDQINEEVIYNKIINIVNNIDFTKKEEEVKEHSSKREGWKSNSKFTPCSIHDALSLNYKNVIVKGEIYRIEQKARRDKENAYICDLYLSDYEEIIKVTYFVNSNSLAEYKIGDTVEVRGAINNDPKFGISLKPKDFPRKIEDIVKLSEDKEKVKRIELAARSNMSSQDGISTISQYLKAIKKYGHKAIALTDLDNVQNYPEFYKQMKKEKNLKPIYGATFSSITTNNDIFYGYKDFKLNDESYLVFDIETTGLSARFNEIIEFGGVIVRNGVIEDNIQFFLKPSKPIPASITKLTNITDELVAEKGLSQEEGIKKIYDLLKNNIAIAHNAKFDVNVCKQQFIKHGLDAKHIIAMDTLAISWFLFPLDKKHNLQSVAKKTNVYYDKFAAHRANYDAEILANVWILFIQKLKKDMNITTSKELLKLDSKNIFGRKFSYEARMLAKNQNGVKKLFKYISQSLTSNYNNGPKFYLDRWKPDSDLLLGSSTNSSLLWDEVITGTDENILKVLSYFDYIELPPISSFNYLYEDDWITREEIEWAYIDLINKAKKLNKICVATSDSRYVYDWQKLIYNIYINTPLLGGGVHWLKKYQDITETSFKLLTTEEMKNEFLFLNDANLINEIVVENTHKIADMVESNLEIIKNKLFIPIFDNSDKNLKSLVYENATKRYGENIDVKIKERIDKELNSIIKYGYSVIYWISHKLVKKSNEDGYLVGSRGSVGSSIVANLANITEVNPLEPHYLCENCKYLEWCNDKLSGYDLDLKNCPKCGKLMKNDGNNIPFETFLGFEANKVPDIDLNFSGIYQPTIHNYVRELFGESHTLRAGTISTVASKTAYGFCKKYFEEKKQNNTYTQEFLDFLSTKTEGVKRTTGQHPGGIIIIPKEYDVEDFTPINYPANDIYSQWKTTHFDFESIHDNVLKLDLLGHDDPTAIKMLEELTNTDAKKIPFQDEKVIKLFSSTSSMGIKPEQISNEITGVFGIPEFGTKFVRKMLEVAKPQSFNDLILLSGLSHGTGVWSGNAEELIKSGKSLENCICCRDDIMKNLIDKGIDKLNAFQIMEDVRKGKGLTTDQENLLKNKNIPSWYISSLKKIEYMFPKAHATAYVIMAWRIAWYKIHHPLEFYASYFSNKNEDIFIKILASGKNVITHKLNELKGKIDSKDTSITQKENLFIPILEISQELYARGFKIENVNLEKSKSIEWVIDKENKSLIPPFVCVEGLGEIAANSICKARNEGMFLSVEDLKERTKLNSRNITFLRELGVLDNLDETNEVSLW
ncbi:PolC-type DNA polymerase III [Metamycoplasma hyosynoviae]|uniref:PolC-type DNA polymerase III n=2 Tax=Metamycoplasma hyosynoviae TaxID=29559 RepID=UPI00049EE5E7|nr:PolC-type DNA polymerase III [Metamycoplasma hyosynoviae]KDE44413.1 DNA polymerase III subunit alpha [Metamycoplasma hyosynoviae]MDC8937194.1 PolC-type DNA polymerase III [Metamycoplasma hyosynoviae]MDD1365915.1 PolC-type DNA polymerase III [Metamycoplasma hyosynoviae]MDD7897173.1 PolC-type DNA polymerase III [Metamycoplasma hyosynoviae]